MRNRRPRPVASVGVCRNPAKLGGTFGGIASEIGGIRAERHALQSRRVALLRSCAQGACNTAASRGLRRARRRGSFAMRFSGSAAHRESCRRIGHRDERAPIDRQRTRSGAGVELVTRGTSHGVRIDQRSSACRSNGGAPGRGRRRAGHLPRIAHGASISGSACADPSPAHQVEGGAHAYPCKCRCGKCGSAESEHPCGLAADRKCGKKCGKCGKSACVASAGIRPRIEGSGPRGLSLVAGLSGTVSGLSSGLCRAPFTIAFSGRFGSAPLRSAKNLPFSHGQAAIDGPRSLQHRPSSIVRRRSLRPAGCTAEGAETRWAPCGCPLPSGCDSGTPHTIVLAASESPSAAQK